MNDFREDENNKNVHAQVSSIQNSHLPSSENNMEKEK
jgi:hypothetical protein